MYEWDKAKREANLRKHGLDFADAWLVYENPDKITLVAASRNELRLMDVALLEIHGVVLVLVYTIRGGNVRCISYRPASRKERQLYESLKA
jgi:uncharacterized protein